MSMVAAAAVALAAGFTRAEKEEKETAVSEVAGKRKEGLKDIRLKDVAEHRSQDKGIWVTYGEGVYDITKFIDEVRFHDKYWTYIVCIYCFCSGCNSTPVQLSRIAEVLWDVPTRGSTQADETR